MTSILVLSLSLFAFRFSHAQTDDERIAELRQQIGQLEQQAAQYRGNIASERAKADSLKKEISILQNQISSLETQITITNKKIDGTKIEVNTLEGQIVDTQNRIEKQKNAISRIVLFLDRRDNEDLVATILKNDSLSNFFREAQYASDINNQLLSLIDELKGEKDNLETNRNDLQTKQSELERLNQETAQKRNALGGVKGGKDQLLKQTKGQETQYQKLLNDVERKQAEFFTELQILEKNIVIGGLYIMHVTAKGVPPRGTKIFKWPEDDYYITQGYGMTARAKRGAYGGSPHNGIDMASGFGSAIKTIGDGQIVANGTNSGWGNWVAVRHTNDMVSLYAHMSAFGLPVGSKVKTGDTIGFEGSTGNSTGSHVHLSLYKDFFTYEKKGQTYFNYFEGTVNPTDYLE